MPELNYLTSRYLPVVCSDGRDALIGPWELAGTEDGRTPITFAYADNLLNFVALELMAGLLQVLRPPADEKEWRRDWRKPPLPSEMAASFSRYAAFFNLRGDAPAFQDSTAASAKEWGIDKLFHMSPGDKTKKENKDIFGGSFDRIGEIGAMMALYGMQAHAYQGGSGFRTSVAGGGPLRTIPDVGKNLFQKAWALVLPKNKFEELGTESEAPEDIFPWLRPRFDEVTTTNAPASHLYFAIPRRLLLGPVGDEDICPLGAGIGATVSTVRETQNGPEYGKGGWRHPLTPYRRSLNGTRPSVSPLLSTYLPYGFGWQQRVGLVQDRNQGGDHGIDPAGIVTLWRTERAPEVLDDGVLRIQAYGVRCAQANVLGMVHGHYPFKVVEPHLAGAFETLAAASVNGAEAIQDHFLAAVRNAIFPTREQEALRKARKQELMISKVAPFASAFWAETEQAAADYEDRVANLIEDGTDPFGSEVAEVRRELHQSLVGTAVEIFDEAMRDALLDAPDRVVAARRHVLSTRSRQDVLEAFMLSEKTEVTE